MSNHTIEVLSGTYSENPLSISPLLPRKAKLMTAKKLFQPTIDDDDNNNTICKNYSFNYLHEDELIKRNNAINTQNPKLLN